MFLVLQFCKAVRLNRCLIVLKDLCQVSTELGINALAMTLFPKHKTRPGLQEPGGAGGAASRLVRPISRYFGNFFIFGSIHINYHDFFPRLLFLHMTFFFPKSDFSFPRLF